MYCAVGAMAQEYEREFSQSKEAVEKSIREIQPAVAGRLPVLDGFATPSSADRPLDRYQRGYYQAKFQVSVAPSGGSIVRVSVKVTAWYTDPLASKSGYQVLPSNGRLEGDLLDQLGDQLASAGPGAAANAPVVIASRATKISPPAATSSASTTASNEPAISAPAPRLPNTNYSSPASMAHDLAEQDKAKSPSAGKKIVEKDSGGPLQTEYDSLREVLKNQAHPNNLVAVKKSGTPVVSSASLNAKTLFLATAHDEFEMLDYNRDWVHVKISGLSRGWIWRTSLEMPESVPDSDTAPKKSALPTAAELFHVSREETAPFPGDWAPLRGTTVKIVSVENTDDNAKTDSLLRLEFAKSVLDKDYAELAKKGQELSGIVLIFDSADGGMIATTFATLQQWKAGKLSDAALWHQCFFDPPETFAVTGASGGQ
jgi:hypothetical protein